MARRRAGWPRRTDQRPSRARLVAVNSLGPSFLQLCSFACDRASRALWCARACVVRCWRPFCGESFFLATPKQTTNRDTSTSILNLATASLKPTQNCTLASEPHAKSSSEQLQQAIAITSKFSGRGVTKNVWMLKMCTVYLQEGLIITSLCDKCETIAGRCRVTPHANGDERQPTAGAAERASTTGAGKKKNKKAVSCVVDRSRGPPPCSLPLFPQRVSPTEPSPRLLRARG